MTFLKTNLLTVFSKVICLGAALFISIYIARFLGPSEKGVYYLFVQVVSILATVSLLGVDTSAIYYLGKGYSARSIVFISTVITIITGVLMAISLAAAYNWPLIRHVIFAGTGRSYLFLSAAAIPFMGMVRLNSAIIMGFNRYVVFNMLNVVLFCMLAAGFIIFTIVMRMGLLGAFISFAFVYLIMSVIYCLIIFSSKEMRPACGAEVEPKKMIGYGMRVFLVPIILMVIYRVDSFILGYYKDASVVGFYSVALSFAELLLFIPESTGTILFPKLVYVSAQDLGKKFASILRSSVAFTAIVMVLFFLVMKHLMIFAYGDVYFKSVKIAYLLLPGLFAMSTYYLFASYFQAIGRPGAVSLMLGIILAEKLALCWLLIPRFNLIGAAIASTLSYVTCFLVFLFVFRIKSKMRLGELLVLKQADINSMRNSLNNIFDFQK